MIRNYQFTSLSALMLVAITACGGGGGDSSPPVDNQPKTLTINIEIDAGHAQCPLGGIQTDSGVDDNNDGQLQSGEVDSTSYTCDTANDLASADKKWLALDTLKSGISTSSAKSYYLHLTEPAESLVIYLAQGKGGQSLGDPDLYVKRDGTAVAGQSVDSGANDCVSYNGSGYNEVCIIDNPQAGDYHILIDASGQVSGADLYATTGLFSTSHACNNEVNFRAQHLSQADVEKACTELVETKSKFDQLINSSITPNFGSPVPGDLNQSTNLHVFGSLSNHMAWVEHLWSSGNSSGIYFETSPTEWWHSSDILTFDGIEWSGGLPVIRSLSHEYVHALDARYNKAGAYRWDIGWWSEGLAEYLGSHYDLPYQRVVHGHSGNPFTLSQIVNRQNNVNVYSWGELAVAFLFEKHPAKVTEILGFMHANQWAEMQASLNTFALEQQAAFESFYQTEIPQQFRNSAVVLGMDSYQLIEGRGGWLFEITVPANTPSITVRTQGGSGNVDLWVNQGNAVHPSLDNQFTCSSVTSNSNSEVCTINNPIAGTYYATVGSDYSGADIVDLYVSACSGANCNVVLPAAKTRVTATQPYLPHWPEKGEFGECTLEETYGRDTLNYASPFSVTNSSDKSVNLHWINNYDGAASGSFSSLAPGQSFNSDAWRIGDRLMLKDAANACIAVAIVNDSNNSFTIDNALVADAATEAPEPVVGTLGDCQTLLTPYSRSGEGAKISVTNSASQPISLHWVDTSSGEVNTTHDYGPLNSGENYTESYWFVGDRMAVYANGQCVGVIDLSSNNMAFEITDSDFN